MTTAIIVLAIVLAAWMAYTNISNQRARVALLRSYAQRTTPIIEHARFPDDDQVEERMKEHIALLQESGNTWHAQGVRMVFAFHYLDVAKMPSGHYDGAFMTWNEYLVRLGQYVERVCNDFGGDLRNENREAYIEFHLKQRPTAANHRSG